MSLKRKAAALGISAGQAKASMRAVKFLKTSAKPSTVSTTSKGKAIKANRKPDPIGAPRRVWQTYTLTVNSTAASPGFATYQFKANDPYRPDAANAVSPPGWALYGAMYNHARVLAAKCIVDAVPTTAGFSSLVGCNWADNGTVMAIGTATASGYTFPAFHMSQGVQPQIAVGAQKPAHLETPLIWTDQICKDKDEAQDATTVAGGGAASPGSLWYFNVQTQPLVAAANVTVMKITIRQLVEYYDCTVM